MNMPQRKHPRLKEYDYSNEGCYFITICVKNRAPILGNITDSIPDDALRVQLTETGYIVRQYIENITSVYDAAFVDNYIIMPDHVHLLIRIDNGDKVQGPVPNNSQPHPTTHTMIRSLKTMVTKKLGYSIWQSSYYEHIIRNEKEYAQIMQYIDSNPIRWREDNIRQK